VQSIGPPALVERPVLKQRLAVQQHGRLARHRAGADRRLSHAKVTGHGVDRRAIHFGFRVERVFGRAESRRLFASILRLSRPGILHPHKFSFEIVKVRVAGRPQPCVGQRQESFAINSQHQRARRGRHPNGVSVVWRRLIHKRGNPKPTGIDIGREAQFGDMQRHRHGLKPHGLPDSGNRRVPDALRLQALLASGLFFGVRGVCHAQQEFI
jgi:hypothetical protein